VTAASAAPTSSRPFVALPLALLPYVVRATRWRPVAAGALSGLGLVVAMTVAPVPLEVNTTATVLRLAALLGAVGAAFLLDDPSEITTVVTPVSRRLRIMLRPLAAATAAVLWWAGCLVILRADVEPEVWALVPVTGLSLEAAVLAVVGTALAAIRARRPPHDGGGVLAAPALVALVTIGQALPGRLGLFPMPNDPRWDQAHLIWTGLLPLAIGVLIWAGRDLLGPTSGFVTLRRSTAGAGRGATFSP
jgi:hypothetical protein